jgi:hypothetical protein
VTAAKRCGSHADELRCINNLLNKGYYVLVDSARRQRKEDNLRKFTSLLIPILRDKNKTLTVNT